MRFIHQRVSSVRQRLEAIRSASGPVGTYLKPKTSIIRVAIVVGVWRSKGHSGKFIPFPERK